LASPMLKNRRPVTMRRTDFACGSKELRKFISAPFECEAASIRWPAIFAKAGTFLCAGIMDVTGFVPPVPPNILAG